MNDTGLIVVKQLPIIEQRLKGLSEEIDVKVNNALSLIVSDDTVKEVKKVRAELNGEFKELETQRKLVKEKVYAPYKEFEDVYKLYVSDKFKKADAELKEKIDLVELEQKKAKEEEIKNYFNELCEKENIDFIDYSRANINVTLSASMKSLREASKEFIDKIVDDLKLIETQQHKEEILIEYKKDLNVSKAITEVTQRHIELEKIEKEKETKEEQKITDEEIVKKIDKIVSPTVVAEERSITLTITATEDDLQKLLIFLDGGNYKYEQ